MKSFPPRRLRTHRAVFIVRSFLILTIAVATVFVVVRNNNSRSSAASSLASETIRPARSDSYGRPEMSFERNQGQTDRQVKFLARGRGYDLFLTPAEVVLTLRNASVLRLSLAGSKPASSIEGEEELPGKVNYLLGDDARQWHTNIPTYRKIRYRGIYPGVDVVYYGNQRQLEYDFVVAAGRDPGVIKFKLAGADRIDLDESGDLRLTVKDSEVRLDKPFIYQLTETGERSEVKGEYVVKGKEIGFKVQAFDSQKPLIIDPVLSYATLLGSSGDESGNGIAVDAHGNAYVTGVTNSATFPTTPPPGSLQPPPGTAFVTKIDATGSNLIYSTYLGFNGTIATAIAVDSSGNAYVTGSTPADAVIHKLNPTGSDVTFSMRFGGSGEDRANGIALDNSGNIIVVGQTTSTNFPTINAIKPAIDPSESCSQDGFVTKINPAAIGFVFSTYLGGNKCDRANAVATDAAGNVYVTGETDSANFPITNAFQPVPGNPSGKDAFATKISTSGSLAYSTYLGGSGDDTGHAVAVDASSNAYITGNTTSTNYPTTSAVQPTGGADFGGDAFVTKLNSVGSSLVYSTYLGGSSTDTGRGIAVDTTGNAYVTGSTFSVDFPVVAGALRTRSPLFRSTDGAANWNNDTSGFKDAGIADIAINPAQPSILYAATFTGVFKSTNSGRTWSPSNNGLQSLFVNRVVVDPATPSRIYAVTNGPNFATAGIYRSLDGGNTWTRASNGISNTTLLGLAIDPVNPATLYLSALGRGMYKSTNGADSWTLVGNPTVTNSNFIVVDPFNHTTIYATDFNNEIGGIFRSTDAGATWERIGSTQLGGGGRFVAVSPHTPGLVYATTNGGLFKSVDGGNNWSSVRVLGGKVFFDPVNPSTIYLLDLSELLVLKSNDNGQTWFPANKGLNTTFANVLAIDPANPSILYTATSNGTDNDAFVTKINPAGNALVYSTCLGGASNAGLDESAAIAIDSAGNAYITGTTNAFDFMSTPEAYQPINLGSTDVFIAKLTMSHSISGHVVDTSNAPLSGAEVVLSDGETITSIFTDSVGYYEFPRLREGGSFTVNANKANFTMAPPSQTFDNLTANQVLNFTATPVSSPFFTISGRVTEGGVGLRGVTITVSGSQESVRITDSNGDYSFTLPGGGTYTVTPSLAPLTFTLPSQTFFNLSLNQRASFTVRRTEFVVTNINNHGPGSLRQAILDANATPGRDVILFNLPGNGVHIINLLVGLPAITDEVFISATGESEFGSPTVELNGAGTGGAIGLFIQAGNTTISGLAIGGFSIGIAALDCDNNIIQGNHIGLDWSGTSSRPNGQGILLLNSSHNLIGGASPSARNVISSNQFDGVTIVGSNNLVQGNWIGPNTAGRIGFGNGAAGVSIGEVPFFPPSLAISHDNVIGGTTPLAGNVIAYNNGPGVFVASETGNTIRRNSIFSNSGLGIELFDLTIDPTVNDPGDPDTGPNLLQNFPLLTSVVSDGTSTRIQGTLNSTPNTTFQIDFYSNVACDPSGNGEGERVFNAFNNDTAVTTDANGDATIDITFPVALPPGRALTATATDPQGNTSEFSPCDAGNVAGSAEFSVSSRTVNEDVGSITVTVLRKGGSAGILAVDYFTSEATATADQDYTSVSGRLVFNNGETSKSFQIQINNDSTFEQDETFTVFLSATNASVNVPGAQTVTLQDRSTLPTVFLDNGASASIVVNEGNSGTTDAVFIARLSAETGRTVSVDFATVNEPSPDSSASATAGAACGPFVDFEKKSGTLVFQPGEMVQTFAVKVCGDTNAEFHESIFVNILNPTNSAPPPFGRGFMVIADDDVLLLALDESGPAANQAAAIESHLMLRDPFRIPNVAEWMPIGTDPNTRVTLFVSGLELNQGESANAVGIILIASNGQSFFLGAQDVRAVPNVPFTQVTFRLPDLPSGECQVSIWAHDHTSNTATIRIAP